MIVLIGNHHWELKGDLSSDKHAETLRAISQHLGRDSMAVVRSSASTVVSVGARSQVLTSGSPWRWALSSWRVIAGARTATIVVGSEVWGNLIAVLAAAYVSNVKSVVNIQGEVIYPGREYGHAVRRALIGILVRFCIRRASVVRCVNPELFQQAARVRGGDTGVFYIGTRVDVERFSPASHDMPADTHQLVSVGTLSDLKNHQVLIRALSLIPSARRPALRLVGDGDQRESLESLATDLDVSEFVSFDGRLSEGDVAEALRGSSIFLLPSLTEGQPRALLEAWACGLPALTSAIPALQSLVSQAGAGYCLPPREPAAWRDAIASLLADPARRETYGRHGREYVLSYHSQGRGLADYARAIAAAERRP